MKRYIIKNADGSGKAKCKPYTIHAKKLGQSWTTRIYL